MALLKKREEQKKSEWNSVVNSAKTLLANIRFMDVDHPVHTMAITSAVPNEGKTFVAANLASAIATSGKTCLLVECDMRRRSMSKVLGVHAQHGIYSVMAGEVPLQEAAVSTQTPNLYFLDAEPRIPNPSDLLNSNRFSNLVDLARNNFDYVLFDTPPVCTFVDAAVLGTKVDAVFMVVREGFTRKQEVVAAANQLKKSGCNLAGMVMNYCERGSSEYYYYYYDYYYSRDDKAASPKFAPKMPNIGRGLRRGSSEDVPSAPAARPAVQRESQQAAPTPVPTAPPARRARATADAGQQRPQTSDVARRMASIPDPSSPARQQASSRVAAPADDTSTYERLAEQSSQQQQPARRGRRVASAEDNPAASPLPTVPYVPRNTYEEF